MPTTQCCCCSASTGLHILTIWWAICLIAVFEWIYLYWPFAIGYGILYLPPAVAGFMMWCSDDESSKRRLLQKTYLWCLSLGTLTLLVSSYDYAKHYQEIVVEIYEEAGITPPDQPVDVLPVILLTITELIICTCFRFYFLLVMNKFASESETRIADLYQQSEERQSMMPQQDQVVK